jgi:hypothetical protein
MDYLLTMYTLGNARPVAEVVNPLLTINERLPDFLYIADQRQNTELNHQMVIGQILPCDLPAKVAEDESSHCRHLEQKAQDLAGGNRKLPNV